MVPRRLRVIGAVVLLVAAGAVFGTPRLFQKLAQRTGGIRERLEELASPRPRGSPQPVLTPAQPSLATPGPLRGPTVRAGELARAGVIHWTNVQRTRAGVKALKEVAALDAAADAKVLDMFRRQYFAHVSPTDESIGDIVKRKGYAFILVGENLALGGFAGDQDVVEAWMKSPGHRANILNARFTEIGVGVGKGTFEGRETWLAVQVFALPRSACPAVDARLDDRIAEGKAAYERLTAEADRLQDDGRAKIEEGNREIEEGNRIARETGDRDAAQPHWDRGEQLQAEGRALLEEANRKTEEAEGVRAEVNALADRYNAQVNAFNACARG